MTVLCMFCCKALRKRQEPTLKKCRATLDYILCSPPTLLMLQPLSVCFTTESNGAQAYLFLDVSTIVLSLEGRKDD